MKKYVLLTILLFCLFLGISYAKNKDVVIIENNIKILANALELYANDHYREYPSEQIFYSPKFHPYILKVLGKKKADVKKYYKTPDGYTLRYKSSKKIIAYKLWCPHPKRYGLVALYFSSKDGLVKIDKTTKKSTKTSNIKALSEDKWQPVTPSEKKAMEKIIVELHKAYKNKDLEKVMDLEKEAIVREGLRLEKLGKYKALEVYYAFKGTARDLFRAEGYGVLPLKLENIRYRKKGNIYQAYSVVPIIATKRVSIGTMKVRLRIGSLNFEKIDGEFKIVKMQMY